MNIPFSIEGAFLRTPRLTLRPWRVSDLEDFYTYAKVPGVGEAAGWPHHESMDVSRDILNNFIEGDSTFAVVLNSTGRAIGSLGVDRHFKPLGEPYDDMPWREIGYVLSRDYWGMGLMSEAVKGVIGYLFHNTSIELLICGHFTENDRSRRVIEKCGFRFLRESVYHAKFLEKDFPENLYVLTREDYLKSLYGHE